MKILQISANWGHGGPGGVEKDIHFTLLENGCESYVAYGRGDVPNIVNSVRIGTKINPYCHYIYASFFDRMGFGSRIATTKLIRKIEEINPDVIQLHNLLGYYINIEVLFTYFKSKDIPVVWTIHDMWPLTGHCINCDRINCKKWIIGCNHCEIKSDYPRSFFLDRSERNYRDKHIIFSDIKNMTLVTPSAWMAQMIEQSYLKQYNVRIIHNGINLEVFRPTTSSIREKYGLNDKFIVLFVAAVWNEMKGENLAYEIAKKLDSRFSVVMIGKKDEKSVPSKVLSLPVTDTVEELVKWYSAADVFVNPTLGDNLPTVNIEALACGTPVVTSNTGGSPEIAGNREGRIVYSKTPEEFVNKIQECIAENITEHRCVNRAKEFDRKKCFSEYVKLYESLVLDKAREQ